MCFNRSCAARQAWLDGEIEAWTSARPPSAILAALEAAEVPSWTIYSIADIAADPHYPAREMIRQIRLSDGATLKVPGVVPKFSATPGDFNDGGPALGEHTDEVLRDLGYDAAAIADLRRRAVI